MIESVPDFRSDLYHGDASEHTALWIPGIQDAVGDREALCDLLSRGGLEIHHPDFHYKNFRSSDRKGGWMQYKTEEEVALVKDQDHKILIANSYGTHRTIEILRQCPRIQTVVLLNPPKNEMSENEKDEDEDEDEGATKSTLDRSSPTEIMLRPLALEMNDETFPPFLKRHERTYEHERHRMRTELKELREGPAFADLLSKCRQDIQILLVQSRLDPWCIEEELTHPNMRTVGMGTAFHYPHVSQPERLSRIISTWMKGGILSSRPAVASVMPMDRSATQNSGSVT